MIKAFVINLLMTRYQNNLHLMWDMQLHIPMKQDKEVN